MSYMTIYKVFVLDVTLLLAGAKYRGEFEERLKRTVQELKEQKNVVIVIDEVHTLVGTGAAEGALDAANILKPALARGELQCIGATTIDEYRQHIEKDPALERHFQPVWVNEPSIEETITMLFLTFSVLVANPKKLLYTVANPARGLLNREKRTKEKVWQHTPPPPPSTLLVRRK